MPRRLVFYKDLPLQSLLPAYTHDSLTAITALRKSSCLWLFGHNLFPIFDPSFEVPWRFRKGLTTCLYSALISLLDRMFVVPSICYTTFGIVKARLGVAGSNRFGHPGRFGAHRLLFARYRRCPFLLYKRKEQVGSGLVHGWYCRSEIEMIPIGVWTLDLRVEISRFWMFSCPRRNLRVASALNHFSHASIMVVG